MALYISHSPAAGRQVLTRISPAASEPVAMRTVHGEHLWPASREDRVRAHRWVLEDTGLRLALTGNGRLNFSFNHATYAEPAPGIVEIENAPIHRDSYSELQLLLATDAAWSLTDPQFEECLSITARVMASSHSRRETFATTAVWFCLANAGAVPTSDTDLIGFDAATRDATERLALGDDANDPSRQLRIAGSLVATRIEIARLEHESAAALRRGNRGSYARLRSEARSVWKLSRTFESERAR